jgi:hypothetical protein
VSRRDRNVRGASNALVRATAALTFVLLLGVAVQSDRGARPPLEDEAREYVRLAVALGERDPDALDFYAGPPGLAADVRAHPPALQSIRDSAEAAISRLERLDVGAGRRIRRERLLRELGALTARAGLLLGGRPAYDDESRMLFGIAPEPSADGHFAALRARIDALVPGPGRLADRYGAYDARFTVPENRLAAVFERALAECRARTLAHVQLPAGERVILEFVGNKPWSAYSRYLGGGRSVVSVNRDFRFTVDRVLQVACHEAYPGHHVRNSLVDAMSHGTVPELMVQLLFSPRTLVAEGSAMYAPDIAFSDGERVVFEREQLFPAAGIAGEDAETYVRVGRLIDELQDVQVEIARQYLDGALEFARAAAALEEQALMKDGAATLKYINQYRSYVTAYTAGRQAAKAFVDACAGPAAGDRRWRCFERLLAADSYSSLEKSIGDRATSMPSR